MNYEEKYNEILEWARKNKARLNGVPIEEVLPELAESEDERIRKELKEAFEAYDIESMWNGIPIRSIFAWLEKQKENPKSADSIPSNCVSNAKCDDRWHKVTDSLPDNGRLVLAKDCLGNVLLARYDGENWEVNVYDNEDHYCHNSISKWCEIPSEKQKEQKPWKVGANAYFTPEQKPAEWSEDDEKMLERAIHIIVEYSDIDEEESEIVQNWLKSLRPSWKPSEVCYGPNGDPDPAGVWKPSEEQMEALLSTLHPDDPYYCELRSLYEQLKKL